jgi:predicted DNA-binding ribbon-helix-helix protein
MTLSELVAAIDAQRQHGNLSSAIRLFVLDFYRSQVSQAKEGHNRTHAVRLSTLSQPAIVSLGSSRT